MKTSHFLSLSKQEKKAQLTGCCPCNIWVENVIEHLNKLDQTEEPNIAKINSVLTSCWSKLDEEARLKVFFSHAKIGDINAIKHSTSSHTQKEQGQVILSSDKTLERLSAMNENYFTKFGFIFITCASGKSAETMLNEIDSRISNSRQQEIQNASTEQSKIILLRFKEIIDKQNPQA